MAEVAAAMAPGLNGTGHEPRHKSSKKRHLDPSHAEKSERKHKRSKSHTVPASTLPAEPAETESSPKKKHKAHKASKPKHSHIKEEEQQQHEADEQGDHDGEKRSRKKKSSKEDKEDKEKKKSKQSRLDDEDNKHHDHDEDVIAPAQEHFGVVVLESSRSKAILGAGKSIEHQFPFYTQTVSQYLPLHPLGISEPVQGYMNQHLEPLLNHYVPGFGGVLLSYRNPRIGAAPGDGSLTQDSGMEDVAILESINEHAVSFGWLTVEIDIFRPSRGAWLEGLVNIQSGGHIGVVCWGKFNASIESERLPRDWRWVDQHARKDKEQAEPEAKDDATGDHTEVHATGYWVNKDGARITADTPIRFRIKNYEVGSSGDYGYLSMEGTMLTEEEEAKKSQKEREIQKRKLSRGVAPRRERRTMLELGMTKFTNDDGREPDSQPQPPETS